MRNTPLGIVKLIHLIQNQVNCEENKLVEQLIL